MGVFIAGREPPIIFDVGGNVGQTVCKFKKNYPNAIIHSFEPSTSSFTKLNEVVGSFHNVAAWNFAMGSSEQTSIFIENSDSTMSSMYEPGEACWGDVKSRSKVELKTVDCFSRENGIEKIDVLKSDTQGYDLEVFQGAASMIAAGKIKMVYLELIFSDMYQGQPAYYVVLKYLSENGFRLVAFYESHFRNNLVGWCDVLFVHKSVVEK